MFCDVDVGLEEGAPANAWGSGSVSFFVEGAIEDDLSDRPSNDPLALGIQHAVGTVAVRATVTPVAIIQRHGRQRVTPTDSVGIPDHLRQTCDERVVEIVAGVDVDVLLLSTLLYITRQLIAYVDTTVDVHYFLFGVVGSLPPFVEL